MRKIGLDARTLETMLKKQSGNEFCTYKDMQKVTSLSYRQLQRRLSKELAPIPHQKPHRFLARHVAQVIAGRNA